MKRKICSLFLVLIMILSQIPVQVFAITDDGPKLFYVNGGHTNPLYPDLPQEAVRYESDPVQTKSEASYLTDDAEIAAQIRAAMERRDASVTVHFQNTEALTNAVAKSLFEMALEETGTATQGDYLRFVWNRYTMNGSYYSENGSYYCEIAYSISYYTDAEQEQELTSKLEEVLRFFAFDESTSDHQKIETIYAYLCDHVTYDYDNLSDPDYLLKYTAYAALLNGTAVCQGYATLFYRMAMESGISTRVISGTAAGGNHAWNIVKLGDKYYNLDATWDAGRSSYSYFLKSEDSFSDHMRSAEYLTDGFCGEYPMALLDFDVTHGDGENIVCPEGNHTPVIRDAVEGDCQTPGYSGDEYCSVCGSLLKTGSTEAGDHQVVIDPAEAATCTATGLTEGSHCNLCGEVITPQTVVPVREHVLGEWTVITEVSCIINGEEERSCTDCDYSETRDVEAPGHSYTGVVMDPTCTEKGYTTYSCFCNDSYVGDYVDALDHDKVSHKAKVPTCMEIGWDAYETCSRCDYTSYEEQAKLGHTEVIDVAVAATCTSVGKTEGKHCSVCNIVLDAQNEVEALGHKPGTAIKESEKAATCTEDGSYDEVVKCTVCKAELSRNKKTIAKIAHTEVEVSGKAATCTEKGLSDGKKCSVCGTVTVAQKEIAAKGHTEVAVDGKGSTCTEKGLTDGKKCTSCGAITVSQQEIPAKGHTETVIAGKAATCTEKGLTEGKKCSVCGTVTAAQTEIAAKGHNFSNGKCGTCGAADPNYVHPTEPKPTEPAPTEPKPTEPSKPEIPTVSGVNRVAGENRYDTGIAVANQLKTYLGIQKFNAIVVASGREFPDALAGSYLANQKKAPILLVNSKDAKSFENAKNYIAANLASGGTVYILGGEAAVPKQMETILTGFHVKRLAGSNRYGTNLEILKEAGTAGQEILICTGKGFADSLSASAVNKPILLLNNKSITAEQRAFLEGSSKKFIIIGGESAISAEMKAELEKIGSVERVAGDNRYKTSVAVANRFFKGPKTAVVAYAKKFPDGLCGGPLAYSLKAPLILTAGKVEAEASAYTKANGIKSGLVLGGTSALADDTVQSVFA